MKLDRRTVLLGAGTLLLDTGATVGLQSRVAEELGLEAVAEGKGQAGGQTFSMYFGILESVRLGDIEIRNTPVHWHDAADHIPCTLGTVEEHGPRVVSMDTGGAGTAGVGMFEEMAKRAGVRFDRERPSLFNRDPVYPSVLDKASLGRTTARRMHGNVGLAPLTVERVGFETLANFTHAFFKPYAITFDYEDMAFYIA